MRKKGRMVTVESTGRKPMHLDIDKGALHRELGVKQGDKISTTKLEAAKAKAKRTGNAKLMKRANFALVAREWKH